MLFLLVVSRRFLSLLCSGRVYFIIWSVISRVHFSRHSSQVLLSPFLHLLLRESLFALSLDRDFLSLWRDNHLLRSHQHDKKSVYKRRQIRIDGQRPRQQRRRRCQVHGDQKERISVPSNIWLIRRKYLCYQTPSWVCDKLYQRKLSPD